MATLTRFRIGTWIFVLCVFHFLAACTTAGTGGGTPIDQVASMVTGKECRYTNTRVGDAYCRDRWAQAAPKTNCYRSLGEVTCYDRPNPHGERQATVEDLGYSPQE